MKPGAQDRVRLGVIVGTRGIKGELRIKSFTDDPLDLDAYGPLADGAGRVLDLRVTGSSKGVVLARIEGVSDRTAAEALKGTELFVPKGALPEPDEDEFYHSDLVGLKAASAAGEDLGIVTAVHDFGAGTILEIDGPIGRGVMIPFTRDVVPDVDIAGGKVTVEVPEGLLEPARQDDGRNESEG